MSLTSLPEEVLEDILLQVNVEDTLNVLNVVRRVGNEGFWRKICSKNRYRKLHEGEEWKHVFLRHVNWLKGYFEEYEYSYDDPEIITNENTQIDSSTQFPSSSAYFCRIFIKFHKLLLQQPDGLLVTDVENPQKILQKLPGVNVDTCNKSRTKLLIRTPHSLIVFSLNKDHYEQVFVWNNDYRSSMCFLTDDYFVALPSSLMSITVVNLNISEEYSQTCCSSGKPFTMNVYNQVLNLVWLDGHKYVLRRFDLDRRKWLQDVQLFQGAALIQIPQIRINHNVLVSWTSRLHDQTTSLKIWRSQDSMNPDLTLVSSKLLSNSEHILWLLSDEDYVIYSTSRESFYILNVNEPDKLNSMVMSKNGYLGQNIISGFLILSYDNGFKIVDFKNTTYLYTIWFKSGCEFNRFCVNEYFHIVYNTSDKSKICVCDFRGDLAVT